MVLAPFLWLFVDFDTKGFLKWKYLSSFLYAIGWNLAFICAGLIFRFVSKTIKENNSFLYSIKTNDNNKVNAIIDDRIIINNKYSFFFEILSFIIIGVSTFYFLFNTLPIDKETVMPLYYSVLIVSSVASVYLIVLIGKFAQYLEDKTKGMLISLIGDIRVNHYFKIAKKGVDKTLTKEDVEEDSKVMDDKIFSKLKSLTSAGK